MCTHNHNDHRNHVKSILSIWPTCVPTITELTMCTHNHTITKYIMCFCTVLLLYSQSHNHGIHHVYLQSQYIMYTLNHRIIKYIMCTHNHRTTEYMCTHNHRIKCIYNYRIHHVYSPSHNHKIHHVYSL